MKLTIPTWLTLARIAMIPVLVVVYYLDYRWTNIAATAIFVFASLTDWLDGWIARRYHQFSAFGAFLDPVADKLMISTALVITVQYHHTIWMALWASVIIGREIAVSALREWMAELGQRAKVGSPRSARSRPWCPAGAADLPDRRMAAGGGGAADPVVRLRVRPRGVAGPEQAGSARC